MMINSYNPTKWRWVGRWGKFIEAVAVKDRVICYNSLSVYSLPPPSWKDRESNNMQSKIFNSEIKTQNLNNYKIQNIKDRVICYNSLSLYSLPPPWWKAKNKI